MAFVLPHFYLSIYPDSNSSISIIVTYFWHPAYLFLSNQGASEYIRCVNIHQLKQCLLCAGLQGLHWQSFHQRSWHLWIQIDNLVWTARSVFARKFQPGDNFCGWTCLCAGDGILKAIPEDFSPCDFSARLPLFSVAKMMCMVCKSHRRCSLGRCCVWCCVPTCSFLHHCITQLMTGPLLRHLCTSPRVTFNLIFSPQSPCFFKETVTALIAPWLYGQAETLYPEVFQISQPITGICLVKADSLSISISWMQWNHFYGLFFPLLQCKHCSWSCGLTTALQ